EPIETGLARLEPDCANERRNATAALVLEFLRLGYTTSLGVLEPEINETTNSTRKTKNRIFAAINDVPATVVKPNRAAINATTRNSMAQRSMANLPRRQDARTKHNERRRMGTKRCIRHAKGGRDDSGECDGKANDGRL